MWTVWCTTLEQKTQSKLMANWQYTSQAIVDHDAAIEHVIGAGCSGVVAFDFALEVSRYSRHDWSYGRLCAKWHQSGCA